MLSFFTIDWYQRSRVPLLIVVRERSKAIPLCVLTKTVTESDGPPCDANSNTLPKLEVSSIQLWPLCLLILYPEIPHFSPVVLCERCLFFSCAQWKLCTKTKGNCNIGVRRHLSLFSRTRRMSASFYNLQPSHFRNYFIAFLNYREGNYSSPPYSWKNVSYLNVFIYIRSLFIFDTFLGVHNYTAVKLILIAMENSWKLRVVNINAKEKKDLLSVLSCFLNFDLDLRLALFNLAIYRWSFFYDTYKAE